MIDLMALVGLVLIGLAWWLIWPPLALFWLGIVLIGLAVLLGGKRGGGKGGR